MEPAFVQERLARLEKDCRRTRRWLGCVLLVLAATPLLAFAMKVDDADARFRVVSASKFELKDPRTGKVRAELSHVVTPGGWAGLTLWDDGGRARGEFKLWEDGRTHLRMTDGAGRELAQLSVAADGTTKLVLDGKELRSQ